MSTRKVLIVGATGVVGGSALKHFSENTVCEVIAVSRRYRPLPLHQRHSCHGQRRTHQT